MGIGEILKAWEGECVPLGEFTVFKRELKGRDSYRGGTVIGGGGGGGARFNIATLIRKEMHAGCPKVHITIRHPYFIRSFMYNTCIYFRF